MTPNEIKRRYPHASSAFIRANTDSQVEQKKSEGIRKTSESQCDLGHEPLEPHKVKEEDPKRIILSYRIFRNRLLDPDNCFTKYHTDALRYQGLIKDDRDQDIEIRVKQIKSKEEYVEIEIIYP